MGFVNDHALEQLDRIMELYVFQRPFLRFVDSAYEILP